MAMGPGKAPNSEFWDLLGPLTEFEREEIERYMASGRLVTDAREQLESYLKKSQERIAALQEIGRRLGGKAP